MRRRRLRKIAGRLRPLMLICLRIFYKKKYLAGADFDPGFAGYIWSLKSIWSRHFLRLATPMPFPVHFSTEVSNPQNLIVHPDSIGCLQARGAYFQNFDATIKIGKGVFIAPNVGIITANHDPKKLDKHMPGRPVEIADNCWIGMNSIILPGVHLGQGTIVGAGAVVTKSFPQGKVVLAGNPAYVVRSL